MSDVLYVSFCTPEYIKEAEGLVASMGEVGIDRYEILHVPSFGNWNLATRFKAELIYRYLSADDHDWICWVDADARFRKYPAWIDRFVVKNKEVDVVAAHRRKSENPAFQAELLSGTILINSSWTCLDLVREWMWLCVQEPEHIKEQSLLDVAASKVGMPIMPLPPEYCFIHDLMRIDHPDADPVIEHMQASRRLKKVVNK